MAENDEIRFCSVLSDGVHLPPGICQLTPEAFNGIFESLIQDPECNYEQAYEIIEECHKRIFRKRRYSSYDSFRKCRAKMINGT